MLALRYVILYALRLSSAVDREAFACLRGERQRSAGWKSFTTRDVLRLLTLRRRVYLLLLFSRQWTSRGSLERVVMTAMNRAEASTAVKHLTVLVSLAPIPGISLVPYIVPTTSSRPHVMDGSAAVALWSAENVYTSSHYPPPVLEMRRAAA
ncbi:hypothetical protein EXIGLDRAFT_762898 [Exidia glandulosa HHB12029]|uniref:Secreted protein n=1 Tax=Exidia glandulosa HHB12029 TaxID=1314781 RepID=A0A165ME19_EXIGL|nr:hypothetical protein EXIGLDRAFT_762898 [Exidia glandulosa HHB12029]